MDNIYFEKISYIDTLFHDVETDLRESIPKKAINKNNYSELKEIKRYLFYAKRSPLELTASFNSFVRWSKFTNQPINFISFIGIIEDLPLIYENIPHFCNKLYDLSEKYSEEKPLYNIIVDTLQSIDFEDNVFLICHNADKIKLRKIILRDVGDNVIVSTWRQLHSHLDDISSGNKYIFAIEPPFMGDDIFADFVDKITFLLNEMTSNYVKDMIKRMEIGFAHHPIYFSKNKIKTPKLLQKVEEHVDRERLDFIEDKVPNPIIEDVNDWFQEELRSPMEKKERIKRNKDMDDPYDPTIIADSNTNVIFAIEENQSSLILFPKHSSLYVISKGKEPVLAHQLIGTYKSKPLQISISKKDISAKVHIAEWLINEQYGPFRRGRYCWDTFYELLIDAIEWIEVLKEERNSLGNDSELAELISDSQTTANDIEYIVNWWSSYEGRITAPDGEKIYIPLIERPKSKNDIEFISDAINDVSLKKSAEKIWEAALEIQAIRNRLLHAFQKIALEKERMKDEGGSKIEEKYLEILNTQELPEFFMGLYANFEVFNAIKIGEIKLKESLPFYKRLDLSNFKDMLSN